MTAAVTVQRPIRRPCFEVSPSTVCAVPPSNESVAQANTINGKVANAIL